MIVWWIHVAICLVCILSVTVQGQASVPELTDVIETIFSGNLDDVTLSGDAVLQSKTDLNMKIVFKLRKEDDFGLDTTIEITDSKCDFQNLKTTFTVDIVWSPAIKGVIDQACRFVSSLPFCGAGGKTTVIEEERTINLLRGDILKPQVVSDFTLSAADTTVPSAKSILDYVGGDFTLKIANPSLMVAGMNFSVFLTASAFKSSAPVCSNSWTSIICSSTNEISLSNVNLGTEISTFIASGNSGVSPTWIKEDGTFVVGRNSLACMAQPGSFSFDMSGKDLPNLNNPASIQEALAATASRCMPAGYDVGAHMFQNLTVIPDGAGGYQVAGLAYSGAAKDPAGIVQALRECLTLSSNSMEVDGTNVKVSGLNDDRSGCTTVRNANNMCSTDAPPSSAMDGGNTVSLGGKQSKGSNMSKIATVAGVSVVCCTVAFIAYRKYENRKRAVGDSLNATSDRGIGFVDIFGLRRNQVKIQSNPPSTLAALNGNMAGAGAIPACSVTMVQGKPSWEDIAIAKQEARNSSVV